MLHSSAETGNLEGLNEEQIRLVISCLDYIKPLELEADKVFKELRVEIRHGE